jgi:hypothetical protein
VINTEQPLVVAISACDAPPPLLMGLVARVLDELGTDPAGWPALSDALAQATELAAVSLRPSAESAGQTGDGRCAVEFRAGGGRVDVIVCADGRCLLQASRPLLSRTDDAPL